jgi:hypothetical protein
MRGYFQKVIKLLYETIHAGERGMNMISFAPLKCLRNR